MGTICGSGQGLLLSDLLSWLQLGQWQQREESLCFGRVGLPWGRASGELAPVVLWHCTLWQPSTGFLSCSRHGRVVRGCGTAGQLLRTTLGNPCAREYCSRTLQTGSPTNHHQPGTAAASTCVCAEAIRRCPCLFAGHSKTQMSPGVPSPVLCGHSMLLPIPLPLAGVSTAPLSPWESRVLAQRVCSQERCVAGPAL